VDFTIKTYKNLLNALKCAGYTFQTFAEFLENPAERAIILRHDVDAKKLNSLQFAKIQAGMEIRGTYYFRTVTKSFNRRIMREMAAMGHEIGYHYETMDTARGNIDKAYKEFCRNLEMFRKLVPLKTVCMHGSPLSKFDNRSLWEKYDYRELGIIGEPYFDIDFSRVLYLTDTGRRWNGEKVSVRDKVKTEDRTTNNEQQTAQSEFGTRHSAPGTKGTQHLVFRSTNDIIQATDNKLLPDQLMLTFHPQRWTNRPIPWVKELIWQNVKNQVKKFIVR